MDEIDRMDMLGFLRIRAWAIKKEEAPPKPKRQYIDQIWPQKGAVKASIQE